MEMNSSIHSDAKSENSELLVYVVGSRTLQNELIAYLLQNELGVRCVTFTKLGDEEWREINGAPNKIILLDVDGMETNVLLIDLETNFKRHLSLMPIALYNLQYESGIEYESIRLGVKGFFYKYDSKDLFLKGVQMLFNGQLWVSRNVLTRYIINTIPNNGDKVAAIKEFKNPKNQLTKREMEILALITVGSKNEEIANKLFISPHTVKTHLYRVFRKIKVSDRLQAALWAAKNL